MRRADFLEQLRTRSRPWDLAVIGGGATGLGIAVDATSRGYDVVLLERSDFGKGTSSRSTKLIHGGVRYLRQGNVALVREALQERDRLRRNAPHLVSDLEFIIPSYAWWEGPFYGLGLKVYDLLASGRGLKRSERLSCAETLRRLPTLVNTGLRGGVAYHDGQFDDARLLVTLARTAADQGACLLNYNAVTDLHRDSTGTLRGLTCRDELSGEEHRLEARCIINATGPFTDTLRQLDSPRQAGIMAPSQGVHLVLPRHFLPGNSAILVPRTSDGRVLFAIPWHGHTLVGTTDTPIATPVPEPRPLPIEITFLLNTAGRYLHPPPTRDDVLSVFVGIRPLVRRQGARKTSALSRDHLIEVSPSGLVTVTGGKWTTYRNMAEQAVDRATHVGNLPPRPCVTRDLRLHGWNDGAAPTDDLAVYGAEAQMLQQLAVKHPDLAPPLHPDLPINGARIVWGVRHEMAQTLEDVLARRTRALVLNARAALEMAPVAVQIVARELGRSADWAEAQLAEFRALAAGYLPVAD